MLNVKYQNKKNSQILDEKLIENGNCTIKL